MYCPNHALKRAESARAKIETHIHQGTLPGRRKCVEIQAKYLL
jgi:hypothetical protein